ncbi:MAG: alpha-glucosidase/alpha-galactosidase [Pseudomonadota bacterium]
MSATLAPHPARAAGPRIAFIGAGSTVFTRHLVGDMLLKPALAGATLALMDIDETRLAESEIVVGKIVETLGVPARIETTTDRRRALEGADFVVVSFQIGGYEPCTVTDFEIPKRFGLRQTIADTLGIGGIMRGLRTVPHLWAVCEDMRALCPDAILLQYVNPMAINTWAIAEKYPDIRQVGLCHSVQHTVAEIAHDLGMNPADIAYKAGGINHMAFFTRLEKREADGSFTDLYPALRAGYAEGRLPGPPLLHARCPNTVRYEMMIRLGYFVTESSEHFAEYTPYFIKEGREDLIARFGVPLDEYPLRCVEQVANWRAEAEAMTSAETIPVEDSGEYAASIINSVVTGAPSVIYGNVANSGPGRGGVLIDGLPEACAVEVPILVDENGLQPTRLGALPPQLTALMRTNVNVQELTVAALMNEDPEHIYHAAMLDPHTAAELDLQQIWDMTDALLAEHGEWLPAWARPRTAIAAE